MNSNGYTVNELLILIAMLITTVMTGWIAVHFLIKFW